MALGDWETRPGFVTFVCKFCRKGKDVRKETVPKSGLCTSCEANYLRFKAENVRLTNALRDCSDIARISLTAELKENNRTLAHYEGAMKS